MMCVLSRGIDSSQPANLTFQNHHTTPSLREGEVELDLVSTFAPATTRPTPNLPSPQVESAVETVLRSNTQKQ